MFTSAIIGCGQIGAGFDAPRDSKILSHANAYLNSKQVILKGLFDNDSSKLEEASRKWNVKGYDDFNLMMTDVQPEILSICVPTTFHSFYIQQALNYNLKLIILEKPITGSLSESQEVVTLAQEKKIPILVNYTRRFVRGFGNFRNKLTKGELGKIITVNIKYAKGLLNNGSHAIDLCLFLFGSFIKGTILNSKIDYNSGDPSLTLFLQFEKCPEVFLQACDEQYYSIFEIDICYEKGRTVFEQFGHIQKNYSPRPDPIYSGYTDLEPENEFSTGMDSALSDLIINATDFLLGKGDLLCSVEDALASQIICDKFLKLR